MAETSGYFLYQFDPVRPELITEPDAWGEDDLRLAEEHFGYLQRATADGVVLLAGRSPDASGPAIVLLYASSRDEALRFMRSDPFVAGGLMRASLHPFRPALLERWFDRA